MGGNAVGPTNGRGRSVGRASCVHAALTPGPSPKGRGESPARAALEQLAPVVHQAITSVRRRANDAGRLRRLEAMLEIASQWNQTHEIEPLLTQMAEAATRLLGADRASIFLWDRPNHTLVGRPALGLPNGELRIPDDRGVVGASHPDRPTPPRGHRHRAGGRRPPRRYATPLPDAALCCACRCVADRANCSARSS